MKQIPKIGLRITKSAVAVFLCYLFNYFRGENGGQNVNKVETGVRLIHKATGIVVTCTEERCQVLNRKRALEKLDLELKNRVSAEKSKQNAAAWSSSNRIVRGNPVRVYEGRNFKLMIWI